MPSSNFIDYVKFCSRSGKGGAGYVHFLRDRMTSKGGPDGGDGGDGGDVILQGDTQYWTLLHLKYRKHVIAEDGCPGRNRHRTGAQGKNTIIPVPLGTIARKAENGQMICEIMKHRQEIIITSGGKGGRGNASFVSAVNRAPQYAQPGESGIEEWITLELKVMADVGLVGLPNAGKSTLISVMSAAKPKIANYPFTTLVPNLGTVAYHDQQSFVMADIPGIIKGAAKGKGLGTQFLKHIERNAILVLLIPADSQNVKKEYETILNELNEHNPMLLHKKRILAISKSDMLNNTQKTRIQHQKPNQIPAIFISSITRQGIPRLKDIIWETLNAKP